MSEQLVIESPDFDDIEKKAGRATRDAIFLLWSVLNQEISLRRQTVRTATQTLIPLASNSGPTTNQNNFDTGKATIYYFTGASAFNLTGVRNGIEGKILVLHNTGAGTVTIKNSVTSDVPNQFVTSTGADKSLTTNQTITFLYLNSRWREWKPL